MLRDIFLMLRNSFSTQLTAWVAGFIIAITAAVILLITDFSKEVIRQESIDNTQQVMRNMGLRITYTLKDQAMAARLEGKPFRLDKEKVEQVIKEKHFQETMLKALPYCKYVKETTALPELIVTDRAWKGTGGYRKVKIHEGPCYMFYEPICQQQYGISIVFAENLLYTPYEEVRLYVMTASVVGVVLILLVCWWVIARQILPLKRLALMARRITKGEKESIPLCSRVDEIGRLQNSLSKMQTSLDHYLAEMNEKNQLQKERNEKLKAAYSEAAEYEDLKQRFLSKMTKQIVAPLKTVKQQTDYLTAHLLTMTEEDKVKIQEEMETAMYAITSVLDDLLNNPPRDLDENSDTDPQIKTTI